MRLYAPVKKIALTYVPISLFLSHTLVVKWAYLIEAECTIQDMLHRGRETGSYDSILIFSI